ncbi:HNH nuclease [Mesorhizobium sp. LSHC420B00]|uniref:HNH endonuclease n=1 Tax=Mesorhizobium sp. C420B TaxID=2956835 RepID=UPI0003CDEB06|nr:HNH nuclease [Mesorhizobium sp. LSHC420B00]
MGKHNRGNKKLNIEALPKLPVHLQRLVDLLPLNKEVHRSELESAYGRSNYARRIRKIIAEYGWDIHRRRGSNGANDDWYTRTSEGPIREARIRREVAPAVRRQIYARDKFVCQMCGIDVSTGQDLTRAQCDHKVPAERGGPSIETNLMTLCLQCNLKKRQACKHCDLPGCAQCPYAFPENFVQALVLRLPAETARTLARMSEKQGIPPAMIISQLIDQN